MRFWDDTGISWTIRKQTVPCSKQITTPTPHHSVFTGRMPSSLSVDLRATFDCLSRPALWLLLVRYGIPQKLILLIWALYDGSTSCVRVETRWVQGSLLPLRCIRAVWLHWTPLQLVWTSCWRDQWEGEWTASPSDSVRSLIWTLQMIPSGWAAGAPRSCSRDIPGWSCTTWSRSELAKNNGPSTGLCQGRAFKSLHLWAWSSTCGLIRLPTRYDSLVL